VLDLTRDGRCTTVRVPANTVSDFLEATEAVVPAGEERSAQELDELIARLTRT